MNADLLETVRHVVSALMALFGAAFAVGNIGLLMWMRRHQRHTSLVPFLGGGLLLLASFVTPIDLPAWLPWCFLLIDPGCSFYIVHGVVLVFRRVFAD